MGARASRETSGFEFAPSGGSVLITAEDGGRNALFELVLVKGAKPRKLSGSRGSVSSFYPLCSADSNDTALLVSGSSFVESKYVQVIDRSGGATDPRTLSEATNNGARFGLSPDQVSEVYFPGGGDYLVQSWVIRPSYFDVGKKYPVALVIHGGPASSYKDQWHMRVSLEV